MTGGHDAGDLGPSLPAASRSVSFLSQAGGLQLFSQPAGSGVTLSPLPPALSQASRVHRCGAGTD